MRKFYLVALLALLLSCHYEEDIEGWVENYSEDFIKRKNLDLSDYQKEYSITRGKDYTHYVLKYYKVIGQDSSIVYFMMNDDGEYFSQSNDYFLINVLCIPAEEFE